MIGDTALTGAGSAAIIFALIRIVEYLIKKRNGSNGKDIRKAIYAIQADCKWLKEIHDKYTADNTPAWYFPSRLEDSINKLVEISQNTFGGIDKLTSTMDGFITELRAKKD